MYGYVPRGDPQALAGGSTSSLEALRAHVDFRVSELCDADLGGLRALQTFLLTNHSLASLNEYRQRVKTMVEVERRIRGSTRRSSSPEERR